MKKIVRTVVLLLAVGILATGCDLGLFGVNEDDAAEAFIVTNVALLEVVMSENFPDIDGISLSDDGSVVTFTDYSVDNLVDRVADTGGDDYSWKQNFTTINGTVTLEGSEDAGDVKNKYDMTLQGGTIETIAYSLPQERDGDTVLTVTANGSAVELTTEAMNGTFAE